MNRNLFLQYLAQTSDIPLGLEIEKAEGVYLYDKSGKSYIDLISGISVSNIGHRHHEVLKAVNEQLEKYMHVMCYGEYVLSPQVQLAKEIADSLPEKLNCTYFVNSGSEAVEGALKLAKRYTGRTEIIAFKNAYHGSTHGALSIMGDERLKIPFRPLLPDVKLIELNNYNQLELISEKTACVVIEPVQAEAGVRITEDKFLSELRNRCNKTGTLLIFDEVQTAFGRTGTLWGFEQYSNAVPDIIVVAKGMGGGMPIGAFISSKEIMSVLSINPPLGHITTFGGHPVCCAAALANLKVIRREKLYSDVLAKEKMFLKLLKHPGIKQIRSKGLLMALQFESFEVNKKIIDRCIEKGVVTDWFLFAPDCLRISPPLIITEDEIKRACEIILSSIDDN